MKRILALTPTYFPLMGGAERTVDELYTRLSKKDLTIDLVTPRIGGKSKEHKGRFSIFRVGKRKYSRIGKFLYYQWAQYKHIKKLIKEHHYDLVHISYGFPSVFLQFWLRRIIDAPIIITEFHLGTGMDIVDPNENPWFVSPFLKWAYKNADAITVISTEQYNFVKSISGRADPIIIFQGTDEQHFTPKKKNKKIRELYDAHGPLLLTVSRLNKRKNISAQIIAMRTIIKKFPKAKLLVVGKGEEKVVLERLVTKYQLNDHITFTGFVPDEVLPQLYAESDIFLLTSRFEGFGIANCEALSSGTPVITYDTGASKDFIREGKTGFITKHKPSLLAKRVVEVLSDKKLLRQMSINARKDVPAKIQRGNATPRIIYKCSRR
jgi:glycosyltransferase involved in cell wall biosynthesis